MGPVRALPRVTGRPMAEEENTTMTEQERNEVVERARLALANAKGAPNPNWDESKHPRGAGGKFGRRSGGAAANGEKEETDSGKTAGYPSTKDTWIEGAERGTHDAIECGSRARRPPLAVSARREDARELVRRERRAAPLVAHGAVEQPPRVLADALVDLHQHVPDATEVGEALALRLVGQPLRRAELRRERARHGARDLARVDASGELLVAPSDEAGERVALRAERAAPRRAAARLDLREIPLVGVRAVRERRRADEGHDGRDCGDAPRGGRVGQELREVHRPDDGGDEVRLGAEDWVRRIAEQVLGENGEEKEETKT